ERELVELFRCIARVKAVTARELPCVLGKRNDVARRDLTALFDPCREGVDDPFGEIGPMDEIPQISEEVRMLEHRSSAQIALEDLFVRLPPAADAVFRFREIRDSPRRDSCLAR